jgi:NAD(P)-dependent dehydrogenase (short-subunit alcohol dehydrogenase family)
MKELEGRTAVVTGAASGIGRALAQRCFEAGMNVALADVEADTLREVTREIAGDTGRAIAVVTDVTRPDALRELADRTLEAFGKVHLLCNNAGVFAAGGPIWETPLSDYDWQFAVNTMGIVHGIRVFVPIFLEQGEPAHVLNTASMAAVTSSPLSSAYYASKHAALSLSETLYHELTSRGAPIGVSVLCPELVDTRIGDAGRNRPEAFARKHDHEDSPESQVVDEALRTFTRAGVAPTVLADRALQAVRDGLFYVLSPEGRGWRKACETRLEDIRLSRNPTFVPTTTND